MERELVLERLAGEDRLLGEAAHAIHPVRQERAMQMDRRPFGQPVRDIDANAIPLDGLYQRPVNAAVVSPALDLQAGDELVIDLLCDEVEHLRPSDDLPGQLG